ncbi:MAG TPA: hypothetical protein EYQ87_05825, partial [Candidatus Nitrosopelagicus sp.]|nr:hypothetical protein [Candidatus Nitrosopelagicus sp.]
MAYGAFHPIWIVGDDLGPEQDIIVAGPVCESGDVLTQKNEELLGYQEKLEMKVNLRIKD